MALSRHSGSGRSALEPVEVDAGVELGALDDGADIAGDGLGAGGGELKPIDTVLTVEGTHVREAYIVVWNDQWVGFWLPNEEAFSPVADQVPVKLNPKQG